MHFPPKLSGVRTDWLASCLTVSIKEGGLLSHESRDCLAMSSLAFTFSIRVPPLDSSQKPLVC
jgi:hypothetical protein